MKTPSPPPDAGKFPVPTEPERQAAFFAIAEKARPLAEQADTDDFGWDEVRHRANAAGLDAELVWRWVALRRMSDQKPTPVVDARGRPFFIRHTDTARRLSREIDLNLGGMVASALPSFGDEADRKRWLMSSLREEAAESSLLEGAVTTRDQAEEMLRQERAPRNRGERMVRNNYLAMQAVRAAKDQPLTPEFLLELQRGLTEDTLEPQQADGGGRLRRANENIAVYDDEEQQAVHVPPLAKDLPERMQRLCAFANATERETNYLHPAQKAALLHFWIGFDHPFVDGNGRTARAIFYWSMLRSGYWLTEHLAISTIIRGHPKQYARAYLNSELPGNDATYFVNYHLRVIERAIGQLHEHLKNKSDEQRRFEAVVAGVELNSRQQALLLRALKKPETEFTYESHANSHDVVIASARSDLLDLTQRGFLIQNKAGRRFRFFAAPGLPEMLRPRTP